MGVATDVGEQDVIARGTTTRRATSPAGARFRAKIVPMPGPARGTRQHRTLARADNPEQLVQLKVRVSDRVRAKLHAAAAAANVSASVYLEELLERTPMPEPIQESLPLAETA